MLLTHLCGEFKCLEMSCSSKVRRKRAYSNDLSWRMVWLREVLDYTYENDARNLNVDVSTVWKVVKLFRDYMVQLIRMEAGGGKYSIRHTKIWYYRGLNDFCFVVLRSIRFYLYQRLPIVDYQPLKVGEEVYLYIRKRYTT